MIKIEIKNRWTGKVLFEYSKENNTIRETVLEALKSRANLSDADLIGANLSRANLSCANLSRANLSRANLSRANLSDANLSRADLIRANLIGADLIGADLIDADLSRANLSDADLIGANLIGADLIGADLSRANLSRIKYDFFGRMLMQKNEILALRQSLIDGKVDGSSYTGECCCFVGTIANVCHKEYNNLALKPDSDSETERWFLGIREGDTPETSQISKITLEWIDEFLMLIKI